MPVKDSTTAHNEQKGRLSHLKRIFKGWGGTTAEGLASNQGSKPIIQDGPPSSNAAQPPSAAKDQGAQMKSKGSRQIESVESTTKEVRVDHDKKPAPTNAAETDATMSEANQEPDDNHTSPTFAIKTQRTTSAVNPAAEKRGPQSSSDGKSRQRLRAESEFKAAVESLQTLMRKIAGKDNPKLIVDVINIQDFNDFDRNVTEIGSAIDNFMDKRAELRLQTVRVKEVAQIWFKASFPIVKGIADAASV